MTIAKVIAEKLKVEGKDVEQWKIQVSDREIRYFVTIDKTLVRKIASFLESRNK